MLSLEISNGIFLTQRDLEKYLSECNKFIKEKYEKDKVVQFEFEELVKDIENQIHDSIKKNESIELVVSDIKKREQIKDGKIWEDYLEDTIKLRGDEKIGKWDPYGDDKRDIYIIEYSINYFKYMNPFGYEVVFPDINFFEILSTKPQNIKRGDKRKLELNFYRPVKYSVFTGTDIRYFNKSNILPISVETSTNISNSNCFVVTTVMGDINHPIVEDFRRYRDNIILKSYLGRKFVGVYYIFGPKISKIIKNNLFLFKLSQWIVLKIHRGIKF